MLARIILSASVMCSETGFILSKVEDLQQKHRTHVFGLEQLLLNLSFI